MSRYGYITPINHCPETGKPCYDKKTAVTAKNQRWDEDHIKLRIYPCPHCRAWHLTSKPFIKKHYGT